MRSRPLLRARGGGGGAGVSPCRGLSGGGGGGGVGGGGGGQGWLVVYRPLGITHDYTSARGCPGVGGRVAVGGGTEPSTRVPGRAAWGMGVREGQGSSRWLGGEGGQGLALPPYRRSCRAPLQDLRPCLHLWSGMWWCGELGTGRVEGNWYGSGGWGLGRGRGRAGGWVGKEGKACFTSVPPELSCAPSGPPTLSVPVERDVVVWWAGDRKGRGHLVWQWCAYPSQAACL